MEPDDVRIRGGHVTEMMLNKVLKKSNDIKIIDPAGVWDWGLISTTGTHRLLRLQLGAAVETTGSRATATKSAAWYIDTRPCVKVLEHSKTGEVTFGSKAALVEAVRKGAQVRYVMQFDSDTTTIQEADNLAISGDNVGAIMFDHLAFNALLIPPQSLTSNPIRAGGLPLLQPLATLQCPGKKYLNLKCILL